MEFPVVEEGDALIDEMKEGEMTGVVVGGMTGPGAVGRMEKVLVAVRDGLNIEGKVSRFEIDVSGGAEEPWAMTVQTRSRIGRIENISRGWEEGRGECIFQTECCHFLDDCVKLRG